MDLTFLIADKPIIKEYELDSNGKLIKHSYPFVYEVTSSTEQASTLQDMEKLMHKHAAKGHCLLKSPVQRPLVKESRAGSTDAELKTSWICLDLDGISGYQTVDLFLKDIGCDDVDHIVQWSSSMGIENNAGFRCHIFLQLDKEQHPQLLKYWLMGLNLKTTVLASQLELTKTGNALRWPLDITTCQNDKLLYIAPPKLGPGIVDPYPGNNRITFEKRKHRTLVLPYPIPTRDSLKTLVDDKVNELREKHNLPKRKTTKYKYSGSVEYMVSPDSATITETKIERGFVYFNLNGGDSWAYYHPEDNPTYIYNFKGEPVYRTEDLLPDYWARIQQDLYAYKPNTKGLIYLAFRDFRTSNYWNGTYDTNADHLNLAMAKNESQLRHFMKQHGQPMGEYVPDWEMIWDPHSTQVVDAGNRTLNTYQASSFYKQTNLPTIANVPPTIAKVIDHVLGHDAPTVDHFINWLACTIQFKTRTGTAWVWQGTQGTGKGVLFHQVLTPIFADHNVVSKRMEELESEFTGFMENKFVVFIDEIEAGGSLYHNKITAKLKNLIVEPTISIRKMYQPAYMATNYSNMIFASNKPAPVEVAPDDRRFNVGPYQERPIKLTATEVDDLIPKELNDFFAYLMQYPADPDRARKPLQSAARDQLIDIGQTAIDKVSEAVLNGDLEFLWDHLPTGSAAELNSLTTHKLTGFRKLMVDLTTTLEPKLTRDELFLIYDWCVGNIPQSPHKFTALLKHHRVHLGQVWKHNRNVRGIDVTWKVDPTWLNSARQEITTGAV